ncbi:MAG: methyltransferase type 11, partial [Pseudomonadota bacterium]
LYSNLSPGGRIIITTPHPFGGFVLDLGARLRLFSRQAQDEHERLYDREAIEKLAGGTNLVLEIYKRFLFGFNQLFILARRS